MRSDPFGGNSTKLLQCVLYGGATLTPGGDRRHDLCAGIREEIQCDLIVLFLNPRGTIKLIRTYNSYWEFEEMETEGHLGYKINLIKHFFFFICVRKIHQKHFRSFKVTLLYKDLGR